MNNEPDKKIRLMFIIDTLEIGGAEKLLLSNLIHLDKIRFQIAVIYLTGNGALLRQLKLPGVRIFGPLIKNENNIFLGVLKIVRCIRTFNCDIVHTHLYYANIYGRIASWLTKVPVVISTLHNPDYTYESNTSLRFKFRKFFDKITGNSINTCFFAVSDTVKNDFQKNLGFRNILTIYNSIDIENFSHPAQDSDRIRKSLGLTKKDRIILNVGRLHVQKGQSDLIEAFNILYGSYPGLKLLIVGSGLKEKELKNKANSLGLKDNVKFLGEIREIEEIYKIADIFVLSSLYEGFGMVVIEAMASAVPVVATLVDGINEIAESYKDAILVPPRSPGQIALAIKELLDKPALAQQLVENAQTKVQDRFNVRKKIKEMEDIYLRLIQSKKCLNCGILSPRKTLFGGYRYLGRQYDIMRCNHCGLMFLHPMPSEETLYEIYRNQEYFNNYFISKNQPVSYIQAMDDYNDDDFKTLEIISRYKPSGSLLDVGCAAGRFLRNARQYGYNVFGVEPNKVLADHAKENFNLSVVNDFLRNGSFPDHSFDIICLADTLEHLPFLKESLEIARTKLNNDGILVIKQPLTYNASLFNACLALNMLLKHDKYSANPPSHLWEFTASSLKKFLLQNNWEIIHWLVFETKAKALTEEKQKTLKSIAYSKLKNFSSHISNHRLLKNLELGDRAVTICQKHR